MAETIKLKRAISLPFLILYGVGTMVGGGFYALVGKVAGEAGYYAPLALVLSGLLALLSGLSFAELSSRYPVSAGEVRYVSAGFRNVYLSRLAGALVILTGIVSAATLSVATIGFLQDFVPVPNAPALIVLVLLMGAIAAWGIGESVAVVVFITVLEIAALIYAAFVAEGELVQLQQSWQLFVPPMNAEIGVGIFTAAFLAFYAFIGFEDMVNIAEEVKDAKRALPAAIIISVLLCLIIYAWVSLIALLSVPPKQLAASNTPVAEMVRAHSWYSSTGLGIVSLLTGLNGALVQIIMAARVAYGMAKRKHAPSWFANVNSKTQTPFNATLLITALVLLLALFFPLTTLAKITSGIILLVFAAVNLALWRIKRRHPDRKGTGIRLPIFLPIIAALSCIAALAFQLWLLLAS
ncbi:APC family permease [Permianibacter aggregans]|uniref:Amino acid/polyamine/organocation transporter (APC superfamily) n=1 Tax=Permianibacter aggregans TaxID=1510150 RepID=A0A4R6UNC7_9GAMM|nr:APC family permease [Permianibacter aggregans]QGX39768.1 amino acid permease [Permianibacter aggregans]TDQ47109.1 amino acid/polyamine/organocation transporter (APC superfamily) [Permianibacter aggregans]